MFHDAQVPDVELAIYGATYERPSAVRQSSFVNGSEEKVPVDSRTQATARVSRRMIFAKKNTMVVP